MPHTQNEHLFEDYLYTECATSKTEREPLLKLRCGNVNRPVVIQSEAWESHKLLGRLSKTALVLAITNRAENLCYQFRHEYNSSHSFAKLSAW